MKNGYTLLGVLAILFWSSTIGFSRGLTEQLGPLTAGFLIHTAAGLLGLAVMAARQRGNPDLNEPLSQRERGRGEGSFFITHKMRSAFLSLFHLPRRYLLYCGSLMVAYIVFLYLSLGWAQNNAQIIVVGLINYLWPALTLLFSVPVLGHKANAWLPIGCLVAFLGIGIAVAGGQGFAWSDLSGAWLPYLLVFAAAVCWSLYTNLAKRWLGQGDANGVALFLLGGGLVLGFLRLFSPETSTWDLPTVIQLAYVVLCPAFLAYTFWDLGTRKGQLILLAALSYFTPLFSTLISALVLDTTISPQLWLGAGLIVLGAVLSQASVRA